MKSVIYLVFFALISPNFAFSQSADPSVQARVSIQIALRTALWPGWRSVSGYFTNSQGIEVPLYEVEDEIDSFLDSQEYRNIALGVTNRDYELFKEAWNKTNDRMRRFIMSEIDARTGQTLFHLLAVSTLGSEQNAVNILEELCPFKNGLIVELEGYTYRGINTNDHSSGSTALIDSVYNKEPKLSEALIACDAEVDIQNSFTGQTALMRAAKNADLDTFFTLVNEGADTSVLDFKGKGIFYHYNLGRLDDFKEGVLNENPDRLTIKEWLESQGHNFNEEALSEQLGFSESIDLILENSLVVTRDRLTEETIAGVTIVPSENDQELLKQLKEETEDSLLNQCEYLGYVNCNVTEEGGFILRERLDSEPINLNLGSGGSAQAIVIYKTLYGIVRVIGHRP